MKKILRVILCIIDKFKKKKRSILQKLISENPEAGNIVKKFLKSIESGFVEDSLFILLELLSLAFIVDKKFKKNIINFNGRYLFNSRDKTIEVSAIFAENKLVASKEKIDNPDVTVTFKDVPALMRFVLSKDPNILTAVLDQTIVIDGNLNYIYKFGYMAQHLVIKLKKCFE